MAVQELPSISSTDASLKLTRYIESVGSQPFEWGKLDCALFVANWISFCTGRDVLKGLSWTSALRAKRLISRYGTFEQAISKHLGPPRPYASEIGSIVLVNSPHSCLGIVASHGILVVGESGVFSLDIAMQKHNWSIA